MAWWSPCDAVVSMVLQDRRLAGRWSRVVGPSLLPPLVFGRARGLDSVLPVRLHGRPRPIGSSTWRGDDATMLAESHDEEQIIARVAALDIGKAELVCCLRVPGPGTRRLQEVSTHSTMTRSLTELANHLVELRVERVVMEATSDYWKPVFYLLEAHGLDPWLVNARDVKHLPGRPKTALLTQCGWPSSPRRACCGRVSCRPRRSGSCVTTPGCGSI